MTPWFLWLVLLLFAFCLLAAGIQGRLGSLTAAIFTPSALEDSAP